jgi:hypothetical protein
MVYWYVEPKDIQLYQVKNSKKLPAQYYIIAQGAVKNYNSISIMYVSGALSLYSFAANSASS